MTHIVVESDLKKMTQAGERRTAPDPEGMSGGPVWSYSQIGTDRDGKEELSMRLAGIAISYKRDRRCLVGIRINILLERIRIKFPELSPAIPANPKLLIVNK